MASAELPVYVIGVSGATSSGKTQLCRRLVASGKYRCVMISMDDHYSPYNSDQHIRLPEFNNYANYDAVASVNWDSLHQAALKAVDELESSGPPDEPKLLLIEGILVLNASVIDRLCDHRVFIRLDDREEFLRRRRERVYEVDPVPDGYDEAVTWPMYVENSSALAGRDDVIFLDGAESPDTLFEQFGAILEQLLTDGR